MMLLTGQLLRSSPVVYVRSVIVLLDRLALARLRPLCDGLREEAHKLPNGTSLIEGETGEIRSR